MATLGHVHILQVPRLVVLDDAVECGLVDRSLYEAEGPSCVARRHDSIVVDADLVDAVVLISTVELA